MIISDLAHFRIISNFENETITGGQLSPDPEPGSDQPQIPSGLAKAPGITPEKLAKILSRGNPRRWQ
jgi:hypothetical protein